jgi:hypothetical protein
MGEVAREAGPCIHLHQQFRDLDVRQEGVGLLHQCVRRFGHCARQCAELQSGAVDHGVGQLVRRRQAIDGFELSRQALDPIPQVVVAVRDNIQRQLSSLSERREFFGRQQIFVEIPELARTPHPDVAGT